MCVCSETGAGHWGWHDVQRTCCLCFQSKMASWSLSAVRLAICRCLSSCCCFCHTGQLCMSTPLSLSLCTNCGAALLCTSAVVPGTGFTDSYLHKWFLPCKNLRSHRSCAKSAPIVSMVECKAVVSVSQLYSCSFVPVLQNLHTYTIENSFCYIRHSRLLAVSQHLQSACAAWCSR